MKDIIQEAQELLEEIKSVRQPMLSPAYLELPRVVTTLLATLEQAQRERDAGLFGGQL